MAGKKKTEDVKPSNEMDEVLDTLQEELSEPLPILPDKVPDAKIPSPKISEEDKERFFKAFLTDKPYTEVVSLMKGKFKVKFRTPSLEENNDVIKQIQLDNDLGLAKNNDTYFIDVLQYRMALGLEDINNIPFTKNITEETFPLDKETGSFYVRERIKAFKGWPAFKMLAVTESFRLFERKVEALVEEVQNENFWPAAV